MFAVSGLASMGDQQTVRAGSTTVGVPQNVMFVSRRVSPPVGRVRLSQELVMGSELRTRNIAARTIVTAALMEGLFFSRVVVFFLNAVLIRSCSGPVSLGALTSQLSGLDQWEDLVDAEAGLFFLGLLVDRPHDHGLHYLVLDLHHLVLDLHCPAVGVGRRCPCDHGKDKWPQTTGPCDWP